MNRDYITEILSKRERLLSESSRVKQFISRTYPLMDALDHVGDKLSEECSFRAELLKYFPISFVACIEGYFRLVYKDLIDFGSPFSDNVGNFKDMKFNVEVNSTCKCNFMT